MWCELSIRSSLSDLSLCLLRFSYSLPFVSCQCLSTPFVLLKRCVSICFPFECLSLCPPLPKSLLYTWIKEDVSLRHHCSSNSCLRISSSFPLCMCPPCSLSPSTWSWKQFVNTLWPKIFFFWETLLCTFSSSAWRCVELYVESPAIGITGITDKPFVPPLHVQES